MRPDSTPLPVVIRSSLSQSQGSRTWHGDRRSLGMAAPLEVLDEVVASDLVDDPNRNPAAEPIRAEVTAERRRRWGKEASLAAVSLGALGAFLAITRTIRGSEGNAFDRAIVRTVGRRRNPVTSSMVRGVTFLGSTV